MSKTRIVIAELYMALVGVIAFGKTLDVVFGVIDLWFQRAFSLEVDYDVNAIISQSLMISTMSAVSTAGIYVIALRGNPGVLFKDY